MSGIFEADWLMLIDGLPFPLAIGGQIIEGMIRIGDIAEIPVRSSIRRLNIAGIEMADNITEGRHWTVLRFQCSSEEYDRDWKDVNLRGLRIRLSAPE